MTQPIPSESPFVVWFLQQKNRNNGDEIGRLAREASKDRIEDRLWIFLHYYDLEQKIGRLLRKPTRNGVDCERNCHEPTSRSYPD